MISESAHVTRYYLEVMIAGSRVCVDFKMAATPRDSSRFAGLKTVSEKFSQPEVDSEGRVRKVCIEMITLLSEKTENASCMIRFVGQEFFWYFRWLKIKQMQTFQELAHIHVLSLDNVICFGGDNVYYVTGSISVYFLESSIF